MVKLTRMLQRAIGCYVEYLLVLRESIAPLVFFCKLGAKRDTTHSVDAWVRQGYDLPLRLAGIGHKVAIL